MLLALLRLLKQPRGLLCKLGKYKNRRKEEFLSTFMGRLGAGGWVHMSIATSKSTQHLKTKQESKKHFHSISSENGQMPPAYTLRSTVHQYIHQLPPTQDL